MIPRLAILPDFPEERWPSMDLVAEMLLKHLASSPLVRAQRICPTFKRRLGFLGGAGRNFDRLFNRMWRYPRFMRQHVGDFDCFHLCDHSYSQIVHELPPDRTGVFCHDLDTFRCVLEPQNDPRPKWFRAMARKILAGFQKAAVVFYLTSEIRRQIEHFGLIDPARLIGAPPAAAEEFVPTVNVETQRQVVEQLVGSHPYLMHVGSCIARKRIDVLLQVFARAKHQLASRQLKLLQIGGAFSPAQRDLIRQLNLDSDIVQLTGLDRHTLAHLYRGAQLVLQPSEAEGFGLPVVEALACGTPVVASDIPVLHEVGGPAAIYCPVANVDEWSQTVVDLLTGQQAAPPLEARLSQSAKYSWPTHVGTIASAYVNLAQSRAPAAPESIA